LQIDSLIGDLISQSQAQSVHSHNHNNNNISSEANSHPANNNNTCVSSNVNLGPTCPSQPPNPIQQLLSKSSLEGASANFDFAKSFAESSQLSAQNSLQQLADALMASGNGFSGSQVKIESKNGNEDGGKNVDEGSSVSDIQKLAMTVASDMM